MSSAPETNEFEFAHKICHALDENAASLPATTVNKLAAARRVALARKKPEAAVARAFAPVLAPAGAAFGLQRAAELADIDAAMLNDELPLNAYLDHGFNAYLSRAR